MLRLVKLPLVLGFLVCAPFAIAQTNLGELLDAGAKKMSPEEFKQQLVQRMVVGPTANGGNLEVMYTASGVVSGVGSAPRFIMSARISGEWTFDDSSRVCSSMRMAASDITFTGVALPPRCQYWFKLGDKYFLSDSDSDRSAKVLSRTLKQ
jgi:hypothetical protein